MRRLALSVAVALWFATPSATAASVDYGPISHRGLKSAGAASTSLKLSLQLGLIADQTASPTRRRRRAARPRRRYGKYPSLSTLQSKYGASSSRRNAVVNAFKKYGITAKVDVTHLRVSATISVKNAQKMFGTKWNLYSTGGDRRRAAREHAEAAVGAQRQRRHDRRDAR